MRWEREREESEKEQIVKRTRGQKDKNIGSEVIRTQSKSQKRMTDTLAKCMRNEQCECDRIAYNTNYW